MSIEIVNPLDIPNWDELILAFPEYSVFHSTAWVKVLSESYDYVPFYFTVWQDNNMTAVIPIMEVKSFLTGKRGVSLPFTDYCDPLVQDNHQFTELFEAIQEFGGQRGWKFIELRGGKDFFNDEPSSDSYFLHALELTDNPEKIYTRLKASNKGSIKKAQKEGLNVGLHKDLEAVKEFYRLNSLTRQDHGLPPQPFYFFKKIYDSIISQGLGFVALADYRGEKVAGAGFFHFGRKAVFKYGASDKKFQNLRANNLVLWETIKWLAENNFQELNFGRTDLDHEGLRFFKKSWGSVETQINYMRYDLKKLAFQAAGRKGSALPEKIFSRMPQPVLKFIGRIAYRHMG